MRLIDADALKERILLERDNIPLYTPAAPYELVKRKPNLHGNAMRGGIRVALRCMEQTPAIDAEPVRHGRWVAIDRIASGFPWKLRCNRCGVPQDYPHTYCPNCGAKMDAKEENEK